MGYGRYSSSYTSYGGGSGYGGSSSYGGYSRGSTVGRTSTYVPSSTTSRSVTSSSHATETASQQAAQQQTAAQKQVEQKSSTQKTQKAAEQKTTQSQKSEKKITKQKSTTQKTTQQQSTEKVVSIEKASVQQAAASSTVQSVSSVQQSVSSVQQSVSSVQQQAQAVEVVKEEKSVEIVFTEGSFHAEIMAAKQSAKLKTDEKTEKTPDEIRLEKEQIRRETKQRDLNDMELQVTKHPKFLALQEKLNARIASRQEANKKANTPEIKPPTGHITYGLITVKNTASFLELSLSNEEITLKTLEHIHDLLDREFLAHNIYKVEAEIGKFLVVCKSLDDMLNVAMKIQIAFNEHTWDENIIKLPMFRKLVLPEDLLNDGAVSLFNGPRFSVGIHSGEAAMETDSSTGKEKFAGENVIHCKTIGKFAQGGQILVSSSAWTKVNQSKLSSHVTNRLGVFKLENFTSGCSVVEVIPELLQQRAKFYGEICSHCAKGIQVWEKSMKKLDCKFHEDHFKCFSCDEKVSEGSYAAYQGLPHCHKCYIAANPKPKCKKCTNNISKDYVNALGAYWHSKCFSCRQCSKRAMPSNPLFEYKDAPYCEPCLKKLTNL